MEPMLDMHGPFTLDGDAIDIKVLSISAGNYALGYTNHEGSFMVRYVGRSDDDVKTRLHKHLGEFTECDEFKFSYAASPKEAFEKECKNYHDFDPPRNQTHPARPDGTDWKCPLCPFIDKPAPRP